MLSLGDSKQGSELITWGLMGGNQSEPTMIIPLTEEVQEVSSSATLLGSGGSSSDSGTITKSSRVTIA